MMGTVKLFLAILALDASFAMYNLKTETTLPIAKVPLMAKIEEYLMRHFSSADVKLSEINEVIKQSALIVFMMTKMDLMVLLITK